jgi:hypothetical protein
VKEKVTKVERTKEIKIKTIVSWKVGSKETHCSADRLCRSMIHSLTEVDE